MLSPTIAADYTTRCRSSCRRMKLCYRILVWIVAVSSLILPQPCAAFQRFRQASRCSQAKRCGAFRLSVTVHKITGVQGGGSQCEESCVWFSPWMFGSTECGECALVLPTNGSSSSSTTLSFTPSPVAGPAVARNETILERKQAPSSLSRERPLVPALMKQSPTSSSTPSRTPSVAPSKSLSSAPSKALSNTPSRTSSSTPSKTSSSAPSSTASSAPSLPRKNNDFVDVPTRPDHVSTHAAKTPSPTIASSSTTYNIQLQLVGIPQSVKPLFYKARSRWEKVVAGDVPDLDSAGLGRLGGGCTYPARIDDLYICASYQDLDGPLNLVGVASPYYNRAVDSIPLVGGMEFDIADVDYLESSGTLLYTILHEMGHVMGLGTNWETKGIQGDEASKCPYTGTHATREYQEISGCTNLPMEQEESRGACSHWDEDCLVDELMTGTVVAGSKPLLSRITIGSLQDLGYKVDYSKADAYTANHLGAGCTCRDNRRSMNEMAHGETVQLGLRGRATRRRLSDQARMMAIEYGRSILSQRKLSNPDRDLQSNGVVYVGDKVVSILIREDDDIFGVVVRSAE